MYNASVDKSAVSVDVLLDLSIATRKNTPRPAGTPPLAPAISLTYTETVQINTRHASIVRLIDQFNVLSSKQIEALVFADSPSLTSHTRAMTFLRDHKFIRRLERRVVDIEQGGTGAWVYTLDTAGHKYLYRGGVMKRIYPRSRLTAHTLAIADNLVALKALERDGVIALERWANQPRYSHEHIEVRPDLDVEYTRYGEHIHMWVEADLGTEGSADLREKFKRYDELRAVVGGYDDDGVTRFVEPFPFPVVVFTVPDEYRRNELRREVERYPWSDEIDIRVVIAIEFPRHVV